VCKDLMFPGLVRDAEWADVNGDQQSDLIVAVEWGPLQVFLNSDGKLRKRELKGTNGIWNFITPGDIDGDGDIDFVAGNLGLNSELKASREKPVRLYLSDVDQNGRKDQLLTYYLGDREVLYPTFAEITQQIPVIKKKYLFAHVFADASIEDLMGSENYRNAGRLEVYMLENAWFENQGNGEFTMHAFSRYLQFAPLRAGLIRDFDGDDAIDMMLMGNFYEANIEMGRYDADYGNILFGGNAPDGGAIQQMNVTGQVRNIREVMVGDKQLTVIARNNAPVIVLQLSRPQPDL
jgi:enediyne biosynthesis protein E4